MYRARNYRRGAALGTLAGVGFLLLAIFGDHVVGGVITAIYVVLMWRLLRMGIKTRVSGVTLRQFLRTQTFEWSDIQTFDMRPLGRYPYAAWVTLKNGRTYPSLGLSAPRAPARENRRYIEEKVAELNRLLTLAEGVSRDA